ncbi:hypothetical protein NE237_028886 [Protea cynaroides]|uniref:Uncharacterized protein n=1 Tax=Protea cynaroides TaxID=273540 RepID=A0A9Q0JTA8_9MAGN|nr:hypothetical protein NE237_028886 [Protea cynaroides]
MAEDLGDEEFWLPSEFLTDDDTLIDNKNRYSCINKALADGGARFCFPPKFPYGFSSPLSYLLSPKLISNQSLSSRDDFCRETNVIIAALLSTIVVRPVQRLPEFPCLFLRQQSEKQQLDTLCFPPKL